MLGIEPAGPIADGLTLTADTQQASATASFAFSGTPNADGFTALTATAPVTFNGSATAIMQQMLFADGQITFGGVSDLRTAGKNIKFTAIPQRFTFRGVK